MGGSTFEVVAKGKTATEAFDAAVSQARYEDGHGGYTGTIAEKHSFTMIPLPPVADLAVEDRKLSVEARARKYAGKLIGDGDARIDDKWGPAGCIDLGGNRYLFFGWASS